MISSFHGKGGGKQVFAVLRYGMVTMLAVSCIVYLLIFIFAQPVALAFNIERDPVFQQIAVTGLKLYFTSSVFVGYNTILAAYFTSVEKALPAHILSVLRGLVLMLPMALLLSKIWKMTGVWLAYPVTEFLVMALGYAMSRCCGKRE